MPDKKLFTEFPPVKTKEWEEKIIQDLKGADYEKKLITITPDKIKIKPYYREEDLKNLNYLHSLPGNFPYVRSTKTKNNNFDIRQNIFVEDFNTANNKAHKIILKGINSVGFYLCHKDNISQKDINTLLKNVNPETTNINFISGKMSLHILRLFINFCKTINLKSENIKSSFHFDPLVYKTITGNSYNKNNIEKDFHELKEMTEITKDFPHIKLISINGIFFADAGAFSTQELGFSLASANETIAKAEKAGIKPETIIPKIMFNLGIGSNYFIEIAKLRAFRMLWAKIVEIWTKDKSLGKTFINSVTASFNKTAYAPYVNQLRNTTEAMSAIIGGTNSLTVNPFDLPYKKPDDFSERIARNTGIILKEEAYFDKSVDPAGGSYYIENLTDMIAENAWKIFIKIEDAGGYDKAIKQNIIQSKIKETAQQRDINIALRKEILLGTNQYPNFNEKISKNIDFNVYLWSLPDNEETEINPIKMYRGAQAFETLRLETEKFEKQPTVFLFTYGNLAMRKARATFASNFFACAGYKIIDNPGFETVDTGIRAAIKENVDIVVICSSDDEYLKIAPEIHNKLKDKAITVIAGYPKNTIEELKSKGIEHFVHIKSNVLETLQKFNKILFKTFK